MANFTEGVRNLEQNIELALTELLQHGGSVYLSMLRMLQMDSTELTFPGQFQRYKRLFAAFRNEMENIATTYTRQCEDPPLDRDMPPFAGRIGWARMLYLRLSQPMSLFWNNVPALRDTRDGMKAVGRYNRLGEALVAYEVLIYRNWKSQIKHLIHGTEAPLLVIVKEDNNVSELINYDVNLRALFREIVCMDRYSCPIPDLARAMHFRSEFLKTRRNKLQYMLSRVNSMFKRISPELEKLLTVRLYKFYRLYYRGFYEHDWYSALADQWMQEVESEVDSLENLLTRAQDILNNQIMLVINKIADYSLIELPSPPDTQDADQASVLNDDVLFNSSFPELSFGARDRTGGIQRSLWPSTAWDVYDLVRTVHRQTSQGAQTLQTMSHTVQNAANRYVNMLTEDFHAYLQRFDQNMRSEVEFDEDDLDNQMTSVNTRRRLLRLPFTNVVGVAEEARKQKLIGKILAAIDEQMHVFGQRTLDAVIKAVRSSLEEIWRYFGMKEAGNLLKDVPLGRRVNAGSIKPHPIVQCDVVLIGDRLVLRPPLEEIQTALRALNGCLITCTKFIGKWMDSQQLPAYPLAPDLRSLVTRMSRTNQTSRSKTETLGSTDTKKEVSLYDRSSIILMQSAASFLDSKSGKPSVSQTRSREEEKGITGARSNSTVTTTKDSESVELLTNCFQDVRHDREIYRAQTMLVTWQNTMKKVLFLPRGQVKELRTVTQPLEIFASLWKKSPTAHLDRFLSDFDKPTSAEFEVKFQELQELGSKLDRLFCLYIVGPLEVRTETFRLSAQKLLMEHKNIFVQKFVELFITPIQPVVSLLDEFDRTISRNITNFDDIFCAVEALKKFRSQEISMDMTLLQAEEAQAMLNKYSLGLSQDQADRIEAARWALTRLTDRISSTVDHILEIMPARQKYLVELSTEVRQLVKQFLIDFQQRGPLCPDLTQHEAVDRQLVFRNAYEQLMKKAESCARGERLVGLTPISLVGMRQVGQQLDLLQRLYGLCSEVNRKLEACFLTPWKDADLPLLHEALFDFLMRCQHLPKALKHWPTYLELSVKLNEYVGKMSLLNMFRTSAMKARHWQQIGALVGIENLDPDVNDVTLGTMLHLPIALNDGGMREQVEEICIGATREKDIETRLNAVILEWSQKDLELMPFKNRGNILLNSERMQELIQQLEESMQVLAALSNNRYNVPFRANIQQWVQLLSTTCETLELWLQVQSLWVYLEAVFIGSDVAQQLPQAAKKFYVVDRNWVRLMERALDAQNVVAYCTGDSSLQDLLPRLRDQLESCQHSLSKYLESKRMLFPRFFFVSDSVLLEILGQASDPGAVQKHLMAVFDNTKSLSFTQDKQCYMILKVYSAEGQELELATPVYCQGPVEAWLSNLLTETQDSLHRKVRAGYIATFDGEFRLLEFLDYYPAQVGILGLQFIWTRESTIALDDIRYDPKSTQHTNKQFHQMLLQLIERTTENLTATERVKYETFITIHLHQKDIFENLCNLGISSSTDFEWTKQTRAFWLEDSEKCVITITDVKFNYQNEFLGCVERLVITPLTDRCYITLAQALNLGFGGCPTGPAGTGKTETVKDMGRCLGQYVVQFNCSGQMQIAGLGRIFKGLAQSGVWGCFDEFNRIELPVLSAAAQQIAILLQAKREQKTSFPFSDGDIIPMSSEFGIFITLNPGCAGRQSLPENLKISFRMVAMMIPDRQIIIRVKLAACGFVNSMNLARKFHCLNQICEEELTKQVHYDFGLRNVLSVLRCLGAARRLHREEPEEQIVMTVLRDMNLSKLIDQDEPLFLSLLDDLFPGGALENEEPNTTLLDTIHKQTIEAKLIPHKPWITKVANLYEMQRVRHGVMALGPSGTGKTKCISVLLQALSSLGRPHREVRMNPKAVTTAEMFGYSISAAQDWVDGIFTTLWRRTLRLKPSENCWLILDGPVDATWIENLNSVLDDTKILTLANGDRIAMVPNCKLVFEVDSVDNASPATISRLGMVYLSSASLTWAIIFQAWLQKQTQTVAETVGSLVNNLFGRMMSFVQSKLQPRVHYLEAFYIRQLCDLLSGMIDEATSSIKLQNVTIFCLAWSCGCLLDVDDRRKLDHYMRGLYSGVELPGKDGRTVFNYRVDDDGFWELWSEGLETYISTAQTQQPFHSILIPNEHTVATQLLMEVLGKQSKAPLLVGESGTGKTVLVRNYLSRLRSDLNISKVYSFSSSTTAAMFQRGMESFIERRVGSTYGPPRGRKLTVFIDDINMPMLNEWGDQVANELVRQLMEMGGVYSLDKVGEFLSIMDVKFVAAMTTPGGGRSDIPSRLKRQFCLFHVLLPSVATIDYIFRSIALSYISTERGFRREIANLVRSLVGVTRAIWEQTKAKMLPTPTRFFYFFNLRDLTRIWQGIVETDPEVYETKEQILMLWQHEVRRVLSDRLISVEDRDWFEHTLQCAVDQEFGADWLEYVSQEVFVVDFMRDAFAKLGSKHSSESSEVTHRSTGSDFHRPKVYEPVLDIGVLRSRIEHLQNQLNTLCTGRKSELVFYTDAIRHLVRTSRAIRNSCGHALLVGISGSGKTSLARLSALIAGYRVFECLTSSETQLEDFMEGLKQLHRTISEKGAGCVLLIPDEKVHDESCYEYVNQLLTTGYSANLFQREEFEELLGSVEGVSAYGASNQSSDLEGRLEVYQNRIRANLHIVLCFSSLRNSFRQRVMCYPGLLSGCVIDWWDEWPEEALINVGHRFLADFPPVNEQYVKAVASIHNSVVLAATDYSNKYQRNICITPNNFLMYTKEIKQTYQEIWDQLNFDLEHMESGVEKLLEAQKSIDELRRLMLQKETELEQANLDANRVLGVVKIQAQIAEQTRNHMLQVKDRLESIVHCISVDRMAAREQFEAAKPALQEAEEALNTLRPSDIATLRKLQKPPHLIMRLMDCVMIMFYSRLEPVRSDRERGTFAASWNEALRLLMNPNFLTNLLQYPKHRMNEEIVDLLEPYTSSPDYNISTAKKVCGNVAGLLQWTLSMIRYYWVSKRVIPLQDNLAALEARLVKAKASLKAAECTLEEKTRLLEEAQMEYENALVRNMRLEDETKSCYDRLHTAHALIDGLGSELIRWTSKSVQLKTEIEQLGGDVLQVAAFLTYCGAFNQSYRNHLLTSWHSDLIRQQVPHRPKMDLIAFLVEPSVLNDWALQGLPVDEVSIQNAVITTKSHRYCLMIDPQAQGKTWLSNLYAKTITVTSVTDHAFITQLEDAMNFGLPLLIEDISENLNPIILALLEESATQLEAIKVITLGDKQTLVAPNFRLYLTTHLPKPNFPSEVGSRMTIIDFSTTLKGLEDQLLARVINVERAKVERARLELIADVANNRRLISKLEHDLLHHLVSCQGSLVDDMNLVGVLRAAKNTAQTVTKQLAQAADAETEIDEAREAYRAVAVRGSLMYFILAELSTVNQMYQFGLPQFIQLFDNSVLQSERSPVTQRRITNILQYMTKSVWRFVMRSLFKKDRLTFTLILAIRLQQNVGSIRNSEMDVLVRGGSMYTIADCPAKPARWIPDTAWINLKALSKVPVFSGLMQHIIQHERQWKQWYDREFPEEFPIPAPCEAELRPFARLLLIRCWCLDRFLAQAKKYISQVLGPSFAEDVLLQPEQLVQQSARWSPIVNFLSTGADPTMLIEQLARKQRTSLQTVSMGEGQDGPARKAVRKAMLDGTWVLLQNCHLSLDYMSELYNDVTELIPRTVLLNRRNTFSNSEKPMDFPEFASMDLSMQRKRTQSTDNSSISIQDSFRLWLTTEVHNQFPANLLQISIKFTNEPPEGIKASLLRTYGEVTQDLLDSCISGEWRSLLYTLAFLHCTVQERRKYGSMGWSQPYEFNQSDFNANVQFVQHHIDQIEFSRHTTKNSTLDWKCLRYMIAEIQYGGRITNQYDLRLVKTLTQTFFHERMFTADYQLAPNYQVPQLSTIAQYESFIQTLPSRDSSEAFHLHANADIDYSTRTGGYILDCIQAMEPKERGVGTQGLGDDEKPDKVPTEISRESLVTSICSDMLSKLPSPIDPHKMNARLEALGLLQPMTIFLRQEVERMNRLLRLVSTTLSELLQAMEGVVVIDELLGKAMNAIFEAKIPYNWIKCSWESSTLGFWFTDLLDRCSQLFIWLLECKPLSFWLTGFFNPQGFLTALKQEVTRKQSAWTLDQVILVNRVTRLNLEDIKEHPTDGVYVHGLYLQGACWDHKNARLVEPRSKQLFDLLPVVHLTVQLDSSHRVCFGGMEPNEGAFIAKPSPKSLKSNSGTSFKSLDLGLKTKVKTSVTGSLTMSAFTASTTSDSHSGRNKLPEATQEQSSKLGKHATDITDIYLAPVYKTSARSTTDFITTLKLTCSKKSDHWILRSVAVLGDIR
ncbi:dynein heavy chain 5 axonemal [Clonorchis sinensis]|uniref:Dynein heavy chain 5 axonemal n=1 Tax=Clonorchis sinensis TaxID=79923 RepID=G7Y2H3_CLOSI|nr:dynein heavy chain 5 axonemal [Clonorchis sinensis]